MGDNNSKFVGNTKLGMNDLRSGLEVRASLKRVLDRLEKWIHRNLMKFIKGTPIIFCTRGGIALCKSKG